METQSSKPDLLFSFLGFVTATIFALAILALAIFVHNLLPII